VTALPTTANLRALPALRPAAAAALDVDPRTIIERWLVGLSPTARRSYSRNLRSLSTWAMGPEAEPQRALELLCSLDAGRAGELVRRWRDDLLGRGLSTGTVAGSCTAIASLVGACRRAGLVAWTLEGIAPRIEQRQDRAGPRRGDVERLFAHVDDESAKGNPRAVRDAALLRLLYCGALRRSEACNLRVEDVVLGDDRSVVRPRRKGHRERHDVLVSPRTAAALRAWLALRGDVPGFLFVGIKGGDASRPMNGESVRRLVRFWAGRAGIKSTIRPHGLRHSSATEVARRGSLAELMALGGWRSMSAAQKYLDRHDDERASALRIVDL
jgi:integrase